MTDNHLSKKIIISKGTELLRIPADRLVYISADGNYSDVVTQDNRKTMVSLQLGQIEDLIGGGAGTHRQHRLCVLHRRHAADGCPFRLQGVLPQALSIQGGADQIESIS